MCCFIPYKRQGGFYSYAISLHSFWIGFPTTLVIFPGTTSQAPPHACESERRFPPSLSVAQRGFQSSSSLFLWFQVGFLWLIYIEEYLSIAYCWDHVCQSNLPPRRSWSTWLGRYARLFTLFPAFPKCWEVLSSSLGSYLVVSIMMCSYATPRKL